MTAFRRPFHGTPVRGVELSTDTIALLNEAMERHHGDADAALQAALKVWLDFGTLKDGRKAPPAN